MARGRGRGGGRGGRGAGPSRGRGRRSNRDDDDDDFARRLQAASGIAEEDDESIDDDLAFDSDDEQLFGHHFQKESRSSRGKSGKGKRDLDELNAEMDKVVAFDGSDSDESSLRSDEIDIADMLDEPSEDDTAKPGKGKVASRSERADGPVPIPQLAKKGKKSKQGAQTTAKKSAEALFVEKGAEYGRGGAAGAVSFDDLVSSALEADNEGASAAILGNVSKSLSKKKKRQQQLAELAGEDEVSKTITSDEPMITAPLEEYEEDRITRTQTRKAVAKDMSKWKAFIYDQKKAKSVTFPLKDPESTYEPVGATTKAVVAGSKAEDAPVGSVEATISALMKESGLQGMHSDGADAQDEGYMPLPDEEAADGEPRGDDIDIDYVKQLKARVSYEVQRRRHFNKIKSKTYRRILRKEKEREKEMKERALAVLNPEAAARRLQRKMAMSRAEERVTQKHKNTSAWVKHAKKYSKFDQDTKDAIDEQHALRGRLMQKMDEDADADLQELQDEDGSDMESDEAEYRVDSLLQTKNVKSALWGDESEESGDDVGAAKSAVDKSRRELGKMTFMQRAKDRRRTEMEEGIAMLEEDVRRFAEGKVPLHHDAADMGLGMHEEEDEDNDRVRQAVAEEDVEAQLRAGGDVALRMVEFRQKQKEKKKSEPAEAAVGSQKAGAGSNETGLVMHRKNDGRVAFQPHPDAAKQGRTATVVLPTHKGRTVQPGAEEDGEDYFKENAMKNRSKYALPVPSVVGSKGVRRGDEPSADAESESLEDDDEENSVGETSSEQQEETEGSSVDDEETADMKAKLAGSKRARQAGGEKGPGRSRTRRGKAADVGDDVDGDDNEDDLSKHLPLNIDDPDAVISQTNDFLVSRAFAQDEVDEEFLAEKGLEAESIMKPQQEGATLPGWGEWGGTSERLNKKHKDKVTRIEAARDLEKKMLMSARADANLKNVIINHDVNMVQGKYSLHMVPRPFNDAEEYLRSKRQPVGPEWNTASGYHTGVQPKVKTRTGAIIQPVDQAIGMKKVEKSRAEKLEKEQKASQKISRVPRKQTVEASGGKKRPRDSSSTKRKTSVRSKTGKAGIKA